MITILKSKKDGEILVEVGMKWMGIKDGREVYAYNPATWDVLTIDFNEVKTLQDKLRRRNMQIKELKKHYIGHLSMRDLERNALRVFGKCKQCQKPIKELLCSDCAKEYAEEKQDY